MHSHFASAFPVHAEYNRAVLAVLRAVVYVYSPNSPLIVAFYSPLYYVGYTFYLPLSTSYPASPISTPLLQFNILKETTASPSPSSLSPQVRHISFGCCPSLAPDVWSYGFFFSTSVNLAALLLCAIASEIEVPA